MLLKQPTLDKKTTISKPENVKIVQPLIKKKISEPARPATMEANMAAPPQDFKPELTVESLLKPQYFKNPDS